MQTPVWPPERGVTIARLAFLAAKPHLRRKARPKWIRLVWLLEAFGPTGRTSDEIGSARMSSYAFACDHVVEHLSVDERRALRETGVLPDWFLPKVDDLAAQFRRDQR